MTRRRGAAALACVLPLLAAARAPATEGADKVVPKQQSPAPGPETGAYVDAEYPPAASVSNVPPELLLRLPRLPEGVEYRFVGKDLVLRDVDANLIIDYLLNVVP